MERLIYKSVVISWSNVHRAYKFNPTGGWVLTANSVDDAKRIIDNYI